ncbi:MAG: hypothetical protein ACPLN0_00390 [Candidatus Hydrothermia bacterium]
MKHFKKFALFVLVLPLFSCSSPERIATRFFENLKNGDVDEAYGMMHPEEESDLKNVLIQLVLLEMNVGKEAVSIAAKENYTALNPVVISHKKVSKSEAYVSYEANVNYSAGDTVTKETLILSLKKYKGKWYVVDELATMNGENQ